MTPSAPPIEGSSWLTSDALDWRSLAGRIVVGVFWSAGCEISMLQLHRTASVVEVLNREADTITLVAIHSPRFPYAEDESVAAEALIRHDLNLLAVHDPNYITWNRYNPPGWPSTVIIDADGRVLGMFAGAVEAEIVAEILRTEQSRDSPGRRREFAFRRKDDPSDPIPTPSLPGIDKDSAPTANLDPSRLDMLQPDFPCGLSVSPAGQIAVADQGNDRVLVGRLDHDQRVLQVESIVDGITQPNDVAWTGDFGLYVSQPDLGRVIYLDLSDEPEADQELSQRFLIADDLTRPTGLTVDRDGSLVIADSGAEQLLRVVFDEHGGPTTGVIAGSCASGADDGRAGQASLAQPVGVTRGQEGLLFCDAATSNLRVLTDRGDVKTITSSGLYDFGLVDGRAHRARLQRPSSLCLLGDGSVLFADTGNDRIRLLTRRRVETLGIAGLCRPEAVATIDRHQAVVADTGNHRLVLVDIMRHDAWSIQLKASPRLWRRMSAQDSSGLAIEATSSSSSSH